MNENTDEKLPRRECSSFPFLGRPAMFEEIPRPERIESLPPFPFSFTNKCEALSGPMDNFERQPAYTIPNPPPGPEHAGFICKACSGSKGVDEPFCHSCFYSLLPGMRNQLRQPVGNWGRAFYEAKRYLAGKHKLTFMSEKQRIEVTGIPQIFGAIIMSDGRCLTSEAPFFHLSREYKLMTTVDTRGFIDCLIAFYPDKGFYIIFRDGAALAEPVRVHFAGNSVKS